MFEIVTVLLLRAHWTLDVFTGAIAAMYVARLSRYLGPQCDAWLERLSGGRKSAIRTGSSMPPA
jgi:hypothetical protein